MNKKGIRIFSIGLLVLMLFFLFPIGKAVKTSADLSKSGVDVPIFMYHSVLNNTKRIGKYVVTPDELENDMLYLKNQGFETVFMSDLINYVEKGSPLPAKPVVLTFDDGYYNNYTYLLPLLKKHNMKAVLSVVGYYSDQFSREGEVLNNNYSHCPWPLLKEMLDSGLVEIQNHSYNMHDLSRRKGILKNKNEDSAHYKEILMADVTRLQETAFNKLQVLPNTFTYPFGACNKESENIINSMGFKATLGCEEGINHLIPNTPSCLFRLKRYNRSALVSRREFFDKILDKVR